MKYENIILWKLYNNLKGLGLNQAPGLYLPPWGGPDCCYLSLQVTKIAL